VIDVSDVPEYHDVAIGIDTSSTRVKPSTMVGDGVADA